ncbi:MAG TPA: hypothetical protein VGM91_03185 [Conexibacter sp.]
MPARQPLAVPVLDARRTAELLPMAPLIAAVGSAFATAAPAPARLAVDGPRSDWLVMPGADDAGLVCKVICVGGRAIEGIVIALDNDGAVAAIADGAVLTARRTAAVSAAATDLLARHDAGVLALFGAGALARPHVEALASVRPLREVRVVSRDGRSAAALATALRADGVSARAAVDARDALDGADLVTTITTASTPLFDDALLEPGAHVNAVGTHHPDRRELPGATIARARLAIELLETGADAGEFVLARAEGLLPDDAPLAELRDPAAVRALRTSRDDVTVFKSVGHVAADIAAMRLLISRL